MNQWKTEDDFLAAGEVAGGKCPLCGMNLEQFTLTKEPDGYHYSGHCPKDDRDWGAKFGSVTLLLGEGEITPDDWQRLRSGSKNQ